MKASLYLILSACAAFEASSFIAQPNLSHRTLPSSASPPPKLQFDRTCTKHTVLYSATVGRSSSSGERSSRPRRTPTINEQLELETIRKELIQKYLAIGHSIEDATREVEYFLEDEERSREYVEMRRIAMARGNDLGIEMIVQFAGAFLVGWVVSFMVHHFDAAQVRCTTIYHLQI
jgi:hypothetical protein